MAYNTKYILNFCNRDLIPMRIEIQLKDYVGEAFILVNDDDYLIDDEGRFVVTNIDGTYDPDRDKNPIEATGAPFNMTYANDFGEKRGTIRATHVDMQFFENNLFNIDDLATSDETELQVVFYYDNAVEWIGYVTPDFFNVEITENPVISLTASDRIGILKDVPYYVEDFYTDDRVSLLSIFVKAIKETGLDIPINVACRMYCQQFPDYGSDEDFGSYEYSNYLAETYVSELRFVTDEENQETMSCYDVLKRIMDQCNCLLTQYKGEWWVVNKFDMELGESTRFIYNSEGVYQSIERITFGEEHLSLIDTGGQRTLIPAGAKNTYLLSHGDNIIYPKNSRILSDELVISSAPKWTSSQSIALDQFDMSIPTLYNLTGTVKDSYENEFRVLTVRSSQITTIANDSSNFLVVPPTVPANTWILSSDEFKVVTVDGKKSTFKFSAEVINKPNTAVMIGLFMKIKNTSTDQYEYFLARRYASAQEGRAVDYTDEYWFYKINFTSDENLLAIPIYKKGNTENIGIASSYKHEFEMSIAAGQGQADLDLNDAFFFIRIYPNVAYKKGADGGSNPAYNGELEVVHSKIKSVSIDFLSDNQTPTGTIFESRIDGKFTKPVDSVDVLFGDFQEEGQNGFFYRYREDSLSIQYNVYGERLKDWFTPNDSELNPMLVHTLRQQTKMYGRAHDELAIGFDLNRINPFARYAIRCKSEKYILVNPEDEYLQDGEGAYITTTIGKYLNIKRFIFVEGTIDYLRSHFSGKLAQVRTNDVDSVEYIYSYFGNN